MTRFIPFLLVLIVVSPSEAQRPRYQPGEVMARFAPGTAGSEAVRRISQSDPANVQSLQPVVTPLAAGAGIPLRASRVASGNWVMLAIDSAAVSQRVRTQLGARDNVDSVQRRDEGPGIVVRFTAGSGESRAAQQTLDRTSDEPLARLICSLERELGVPVIGEVIAPSALALQVDLRALTLNVVERLQALPEIEAAQPNYILRRMR